MKFRYSQIIAHMIFIIASILISCRENSPSDTSGFNLDFREHMRIFVTRIATHARQYDPDFIIIQQNAQDLIAESVGDSLETHNDYINVIDAISRESLFYGYTDENINTSQSIREEILPYLTLAKSLGLQILVTDYCWSREKVDSSYLQNHQYGFLSFAASHLELDNIPEYPTPIFDENSSDIHSLDSARNFLYLINPQNFADVEEFISAIEATNYDIIVIDAFFHDNLPITRAHVERLKKKANGGRRLVISYMSIGEAEDYRFYWQESWYQHLPPWILEENPNWQGNYLVLYWEKAWQDIIINREDSYLNRILRAGFDGVFLDIVDAYEYFESHF